MRNFDDRDDNKPTPRHSSAGLSGLGIAMVLGVAVVSAYALSHKNAPVKPASGSAQAMSLASFKPSTR